MMRQAQMRVDPHRGPELRTIIAAARQAPSVHNTQPWRWRIDRRVLELRSADLTQRWRVEGLVDRATAAQDRDHRFAAEQQAWTDRGPSDGIQSTALARWRRARRQGP